MVKLGYQVKSKYYTKEKANRGEDASLTEAHCRVTVSIWECGRNGRDRLSLALPI